MLLDKANEVISEQAPKVEYANKVLAGTGCWTTTTIAKELGMSAVTLNSELHKRGIQYYTDGHWVLYHKFQNQGYTKTRTYAYTDPEGNQRTSIQTVWTERGREFIHNLIKGNRKVS